MFDKRVRIPVSGNDRQLAIAGCNSERRNAAWYRLHDEMQYRFANRRETCRVRERSSQPPRGRVERPRCTAASSRPTQFARELDEVLRRSCPVSF